MQFIISSIKIILDCDRPHYKDVKNKSSKPNNKYIGRTPEEILYYIKYEIGDLRSERVSTD